MFGIIVLISNIHNYNIKWEEFHVYDNKSSKYIPNISGVYIINYENSPIKIGYSKDLKVRYSEYLNNSEYINKKFNFFCFLLDNTEKSIETEKLILVLLYKLSAKKKTNEEILLESFPNLYIDKLIWIIIFVITNFDNFTRLNLFNKTIKEDTSINALHTLIDYNNDLLYKMYVMYINKNSIHDYILVKENTKKRRRIREVNKNKNICFHVEDEDKKDTNHNQFDIDNLILMLENSTIKWKNFKEIEKSNFYLK